MKAEELLEKLKRIDRIPQKGYNVKGEPAFIQTVIVDGEFLIPRWHKRCKQYKINLINQFKKEIEKNKCEKCRYDFEDKDKPSPYHDVEKYYSTE